MVSLSKLVLFWAMFLYDWLLNISCAVCHCTLAGCITSSCLLQLLMMTDWSNCGPGSFKPTYKRHTRVAGVGFQKWCREWLVYQLLLLLPYLMRFVLKLFFMHSSQLINHQALENRHLGHMITVAEILSMVIVIVIIEHHAHCLSWVHPKLRALYCTSRDKIKIWRYAPIWLCLTMSWYIHPWPCLHLGWHTGTARVGKVQPAPVPAKPVPMACFTCTHTANPWVLGNTAGTCKPIPVFHYFSIST